MGKKARPIAENRQNTKGLEKSVQIYSLFSSIIQIFLNKKADFYVQCLHNV